MWKARIAGCGLCGGEHRVAGDARLGGPDRHQDQGQGRQPGGVELCARLARRHDVHRVERDRQSVTGPERRDGVEIGLPPARQVPRQVHDDGVHLQAREVVPEPLRHAERGGQPLDRFRQRRRHGSRATTSTSPSRSWPTRPPTPLARGSCRSSTIARSSIARTSPAAPLTGRRRSTARRIRRSCRTPASSARST